MASRKGTQVLKQVCIKNMSTSSEIIRGWLHEATSNLDQDDATAFTLGVDYKYRFPFAERMFGIGVLGEVVFFDKNSLY